MTRLVIQPTYRPRFEAAGLTSAAAVIEHFTRGDPPLARTVLVKPFHLELPGGPGMAVFYKQYEYRPPSWQFAVRPSKAQCECRNYEIFGSLGIPCAEPIAWAEQRDGWQRLQRAVLITRTIPEARTLVDFLRRSKDPARGGEDWRARRQVARRLGELTCQLHAANFFHHDLVGRNVLVTTRPGQPPQVWWIDCPRGGFDPWSPWRFRRRLKDLASLDKTGARFGSRAERVAFLRSYLGLRRLDLPARQLIAAVTAYRKQRWPDDWEVPPA